MFRIFFSRDRSVQRGLLFISSILLSVLLLWAIMPAGPEKVVLAAGAGDITVCPGGVDCDYASLKEAISHAAKGDTIWVAPGTYTETGQIILEKSLTIQAGGTEKPVIKPNKNTGSGAGDERGWWIVSPGVGVTLTQIILDGSEKDVMEALRVHGSLIVNDSEFNNLKYSHITSPADPYNDIQGVAIYLDQGSVGDIRNSQFAEIGRIGVLACGGDRNGSAQTNLIFRGNTYTGKGQAGPLDFAVWVGGDVKSQIVENSVSENAGQAGGLSSSAVQVQAGVVCPRTGAPVVEVKFNRFVDNLFGVQNAITSQVKAENNWWGCSAGPGQPGCDAVSGNIDYTPWIVLKLAVAPARILNGGNATVTASLTYNSALSDTAAQGYFVPGSVSFSGALGTLYPEFVAFSNGLAQSTFTAGSIAGMASISAQVDHQLDWANLIVDKVSIFLPVVYGKPVDKVSIFLPVVYGKPLEIFYDDFEDADPTWEVESTDPASSVSYVGGKYQVTIPTQVKRTTAVAPIMLPGGHYSVEVETRLISGNSTAFGIIFNRKGPESYYAFIITPANHYFSLWKREPAGMSGTWVFLSDGTDDVIDSSQNMIKVESQGNNLSLWVNSIEMKSFDDATYDSMGAKVGLQVWAFNDMPAIAQFDNFEVMRIP